MVFFDVLERGSYELFNSDGTAMTVPEKIRDSSWNGTFEDIDLTNLRSLLKTGTTDVYCDPVVYYSTKDRDSFVGSDWDTSKTETWSTVMPANKADITAVAVDCTKATDGSEFTMFGRQSANLYITMRAPTGTEFIDTDSVNQALFMGTSSSGPSSSNSETTVTLTEEEPEIHKTSDPETGTQEEPTIISSGDDLTYTISVKNTNTEFTVPDIIVEDPLPTEVTVNTSEILVHFGNPSRSLPIAKSPRAKLVVRNGKLIFTINSLEPEETCYFVIPTKAKASGGSIIENTSRITKVNGVDKEIDSETTYHKVEFDIIFSKQSDIKKLVIGATLQLWNTDEAEPELVEEWVTGTANKTIRLHTGHYVLKETDVPDGYAIADDLVFEVQDDGTILYESGTEDTKVIMVDVASTQVKGIKTWKYDSESDRPESITLHLYRTIDPEVDPVDSGRSVTTDSTKDWKYDFGLVPKYDNDGNEYIYSVVEDPIQGYNVFYSGTKETNALRLKFNSQSKTYNSSDWLRIFYDYKGKMFATPVYYGTSLSGLTIDLPTDSFWIAWYTDAENNDYGFKFESITPIVMEDNGPVGTRLDLNYNWLDQASHEEYSNSKYPETDHDYFIYEKVLMHYTADMINDVIEVVNSKENLGFDVTIDKVSERDEKLGGVVLEVTSNPEIGDAVIDPIEWTTVEGESKVLQLQPGHYTLHEKSPIRNYQRAQDIDFLVNQEGKVVIGEEVLDSIKMIDLDAEQPIPFRKVWDDEGYEDRRPSSVTFDLVRDSDDEVVATKTLTSDDATSDVLWEGEFEPVPVIDDEWNPITYHVVERNPNHAYRVTNSSEAKKGFLITFTEDSDIGTGHLSIYTGDISSSTTPYDIVNKGQLVLNKKYNMAYAEGKDMAGTTYYVPVINGVEAFHISLSNASNSQFQKLEIESIVPTTETQEYEIINSSTYSQTNKFTLGNFPEFGVGTGKVTSATFVWPESGYNDDPDALYSGEVTNSINLRDLSFSKHWEGDDPSNRPSTLTFNLFNVKDMDTPVSSITVDVEDDTQEYTFKDIPKYNDDWTLAQYVVREEPVENYRTVYTPDEIKGFLVTFSEDSAVTNGSVCFYSCNETNQVGGPVYLYGKNGSNYSSLSSDQMAGKTYYVPVADSSHPGFVMYVRDSRKSAHVKLTSIVPVDYSMLVTGTSQSSTLNSYMTQWFIGENPEVSITERDIETYKYVGYRYQGEYNDVHNVYDKTSVPVDKIWSGDTPSERPAEITINAYNTRDLDTIVGSVVMTADDCVENEQDHWHAEITDLPKYNSDGTLAEYILKEDAVEGYIAKYTKPVGMYITFSKDSWAGSGGSTQSIQIFSVDKRVGYRIKAIYCYYPENNSTNSSYYGFDVTGKTYYVPLEDPNSYDFCIYKGNTASKIKIEKVSLTCEAPDFKYSVYNGSIYSSDLWLEGNGQDIDLTGKSGYIYYHYTGVDPQTENAAASFDKVVVNEKNIINLPFTKKWVDAGYEENRPESLTFELYNVKNPDVKVAEKTLTVSDASSDGTIWSGSFENVPKFNSDGTLAYYTVKEASVPDGYKSFSSTKGIKGFLVKFSEDTHFDNGYVTLYASSDCKATRAICKGNYLYNYSWSGDSLAGKEIYVPVDDPEKPEFMIYFSGNNSSSYTNKYTIESIIPTCEERKVTSYSSVYTRTSTSSANYELKEDITSYSKSTPSNYSYYATWIRWNLESPLDLGVVNYIDGARFKVHKYSNNVDYVPGAVLQIIREEDNVVMDEWTTVDGEDHEVALLEGNYILHEVSAPYGFCPAEDMPFKVSSDKKLIYKANEVTQLDMLDVEAVKISGQKSWSGDTEDQRPNKITVRLLQDGKVVDTQETTAENDWKYLFEGWPRYEGAGTSKEHVYTVSEEPVYDYIHSTDTAVTSGHIWADKAYWEFEDPSIKGLKFTLSPNSVTESVYCDWIEIYYKKDNVTYKYNETYSGMTGRYGGNKIGGMTFSVPSQEVYIVWRTDSSVVNYGFKIDSATPLYEEPAVASIQAAIPTVDSSFTYVMKEYGPDTGLPETAHQYDNGEHFIYHYANSDLVPLTEESHQTAVITQNITNTRLPDKTEYSVYKKNLQGTPIAGAELKITGRETGVDYDVTYTWTSTANQPDKIGLRPGSYVFSEVLPPEGYLIAEEIPFVITEDGKILVNGEEVEALEMLDTPNVLKIPVTKSWDDAGFSQYRPESITFDLYDKSDMDTVVDSLTVTAEDNWSGEFEVPLAKRDSTEQQIEYTVKERNVQYYDKEVVTDFVKGDYGSSVNSIGKSMKHTPNNGMRVYFSGNTYLNGPVFIVWKDRVSGDWYTTSISPSSYYNLYLSAKEVYIMYRSYANRTGIDIDGVYEQDGSRSMITGGYRFDSSYSATEAIRLSIARMQGSNDYFPTDLSASDFVTTTSSYHNSVASEDYTTHRVMQLVHAVAPQTSTEVITKLPTQEEIDAANGMRVTFGDDCNVFNGPTCLVYKTSDGKYVCGSLTPTSSKVYDIPSKEFYLFFRDANAKTDSAAIMSTGYTIKKVEAIESGNWLSYTGTKYDTPIEAVHSFNSTYFFDIEESDIIDGRLGVSMKNTQSTVGYSFDYENMPISYNKYYADNQDGFVAEQVAVKNTFDLHKWDVPFKKVNSHGAMIANAHLKLYKADGTTLVSEWDSSATAAHVESLDYGSYILK